MVAANTAETYNEADATRMEKRRSVMVTRVSPITMVFTLLLVLTLLTPVEAAAGRHIPPVIADFEGGLPAGFFHVHGTSAVAVSTDMVGESDPLALPGQVGENRVLSSSFSVVDFGGFGQELFFIPRDWSAFEGFSFWFYVFILHFFSETQNCCRII